jgi:PAS domain S-box-containing protein
MNSALESSEVFVAGQVRVLEMILEGAPLGDVLGSLCRIVEDRSEGDAIAGILLVDSTGTKLHHGAAPSLPHSYNNAIDGLEIAPNVGTCCDAAATGSVVFTKDIESAPSWSSFKHLPLGLGLRAAWSMPIKDSGGRVLGTFGTYFRSCRLPGAMEQNVVTLLSRTAAVAISHARTSARMKDREQYLRAVFETTPDCIKVVARDGSLQEMNPAGLKMVEANEGDNLNGQCVFDLIAPEDREKFKEHHQRVCEGGGGILEYDIVGLCGTRRSLETHAVPLTKPDGSTQHLAVTREITVRKRLEEELRKRANELQEADQRKDQFIAMLAHELRNPLAPIRNGLHILKSPKSTPEQARHACQIMQRQVTHLARMVDDLLDTSRIINGKINMSPERVNLVELVRHTVQDLVATFDEQKLKLQIEFEQNEIWLNADRTRISQAISNLLNNAIKFSDTGGAIFLRVSMDPATKRACVSVRDNGAGIAPALLQRLFQPFVQADTSLDRGRGGLGLGLALVRRLVELHGGKAEVLSEGLGKGSEFRIHLPVNTEAAVESKPFADTGSSKHTVLIIEDNEDVAESLKMLLELDGHTIVLAANGVEGIKAFSSLQPSVLICDIGLPGELDGYAVARQINAQKHQAKLIALSGYGQAEDKQKSVAAGFHIHLTKPVLPERLCEVLARN